VDFAKNGIEVPVVVIKLNLLYRLEMGIFLDSKLAALVYHIRLRSVDRSFLFDYSFRAIAFI